MNPEGKRTLDFDDGTLKPLEKKQSTEKYAKISKDVKHISINHMSTLIKDKEFQQAGCFVSTRS